MSNDFIPPTPVIEDAPVDLGVVCTPEESESRLSLCKTCSNFSFDTAQQHTICQGTNCNISLMTSFKFKQCPMEKW